MSTSTQRQLNVIDAHDIGILMFLVVLPSGEAEIVKSGGCDDLATDNDLLSFDQQATTYFGETTCVAGTYKPRDACSVGCHSSTRFRTRTTPTSPISTARTPTAPGGSSWR